MVIVMLKCGENDFTGIVSPSGITIYVCNEKECVREKFSVPWGSMIYERMLHYTSAKCADLVAEVMVSVFNAVDIHSRVNMGGDIEYE